ncbi:MAG: oligosaccharide flippase family protein [Candidatus Magasanikbacteria bacterium]|nr:oligosaccharide flippase family protein [Candidatus Magasanikbacteria bacterium]
MKKIYTYIRNQIKQYLKIDIHYLAKSGFWLTLKQLVISITSFLLTIALANVLTPDEYGLFRYILAAVSILILTSLPGMSTALQQTVAQGNDKTIVSIIKTRLYWGSIGAILCLALSGFYYIQQNISIASIYLALTPILLVLSPFSSFDDYLIGKKKFQLSTMLTTIGIVGQMLFLLSILYVTHNINVVILSYFLFTAAFRFFSYSYVKKRFTEDIRQSVSDTESITYGKHLSAMNILPTIGKHIDKIIIFHYFSAAELAIYSFAIAPVEYISSFLVNINTALLPKLTTKKNTDIQKNKYRHMILLGICIVPIVIIYMISTPYIFHTIFPGYSAAIVLSQIYAIILLTYISIIPATFLEAKKQIKKLYYLRTVIPIITIVLLFCSIPYGILGIICGKIIIQVIRLGYLLYLTKHSES